MPPSFPVLAASFFDILFLLVLPMKTRILPILALLLCPLSPAFGEEKLSDAAIKANLLGHWGERASRLL
jgi:hypothetical protein